MSDPVRGAAVVVVIPTATSRAARANSIRLFVDLLPKRKAPFVRGFCVADPFLIRTRL